MVIVHDDFFFANSLFAFNLGFNPRKVLVGSKKGQTSASGHHHHHGGRLRPIGTSTKPCPPPDLTTANGTAIVPIPGTTSADTYRDVEEIKFVSYDGKIAPTTPDPLEAFLARRTSTTTTTIRPAKRNEVEFGPGGEKFEVREKVEKFLKVCRISCEAGRWVGPTCSQYEGMTIVCFEKK
jgi:hypothetical protein